jgi:hypothetical protein
MTNKKISALTAATTPLAGTEVLPIVQSSATTQVSVANLTAGRSVSVADLTVSTGNITPSTAAKGINFTANTGAAGKTSQLLNWYEEGTWTPNQGAGLTVVGAFSSSGTYTRIGRQVTVRGTVTGATSIACSAVGVITSNLPFTSALNNPGIYINDALAAFGGVDALNNSVYAIGAIAVCSSIYFTVTYNA